MNDHSIGGKSSTYIEADRLKTNGFDEYIQSDPCKFDHHDLFKMLQTATLDFRLNDPYCSLVNFLTKSTIINTMFCFIRAG
jgi:hypothetical protein